MGGTRHDSRRAQALLRGRSDQGARGHRGSRIRDDVRAGRFWRRMPFTTCSPRPTGRLSTKPIRTTFARCRTTVRSFSIRSNPAICGRFCGLAIRIQPITRSTSRFRPCSTCSRFRGRDTDHAVVAPVAAARPPAFGTGHQTVSALLRLPRRRLYSDAGRTDPETGVVPRPPDLRVNGGHLRDADVQRDRQFLQPQDRTGVGWATGPRAGSCFCCYRRARLHRWAGHIGLRGMAVGGEGPAVGAADRAGGVSDGDSLSFRPLPPRAYASAVRPVGLVDECRRQRPGIGPRHRPGDLSGPSRDSPDRRRPLPGGLAHAARGLRHSC